MFLVQTEQNENEKILNHNNINRCFNKFCSARLDVAVEKDKISFSFGFFFREGCSEFRFFAEVVFLFPDTLSAPNRLDELFPGKNVDASTDSYRRHKQGINE